MPVKAERGRGFLRKLDRWIGVPALLGLSLFRKKRPKPAQFNSIGICVFAAIGDALLASSLIADLRNAFPGLKITVFATPANVATFDLITGYDDLVLVPITNPWAAIGVVSSHPVDILIDSSQWPRIGALVAALSGARWTIGFETAGQNRHYSYDICVKHSSKAHELDNFRSLLSPLGVQAKAMPPLDLSTLAGIECLNIKQPYLVLHPWASGNHFELREWPIASWVSLASQVLRSGYGVVISGGPGDVDRAADLCLKIERASGDLTPVSLLNLVGQTNLLTTAAYVNGAAAVVAVNTGTMHLAALLGKPLVALHGPTNPDRWGPIYPGARNEQNTLILGPGFNEGGAYLNLGFEYPENPTYLMDQISVEAVVDALRKFSINIE
ncbi:glycosyltransferase family 9 protein [Polynucleobacter sp. 15G-AUS-farblos]|uniref:glycosyltransferase family 9 protein n=1 Tax=Polynucleobacter sp. 15G-AUS-farblos TaxID=2689094 RepID=UPI001C0B73F9|nr:glycosyltransferase family 9 protein [Polynucleobacter sp. 15G-AUS-farblos]MBU3583793.1 glycosyltransferase family 9 protein [Polynucleobacter sp. 15G-AUS-farblos]